ncbi:MAG: HAD family hydrolase [Vicinamibacterales bacterium]
MRSFDLIAFDGDDTLWHNERSFRHGRERFRAILADAGFALNEDEVELAVNDVELRNLSFFGYGVASFTLSLIEAAVGLTGGHIVGRHIDDIVSLAKLMITTEMELLPSVKPTLTALSRRYPLMLITKGDLLHQRSKLARSGLERHFRFVEVVSHKTPEVYATILEQRNVRPARFLMVGNSLRSDILPVVKIGARAVHIPAALTWSHEHAEASTHARRRFYERKSMRQLAHFIESLGLEAQPPARRRATAPKRAR